MQAHVLCCSALTRYTTAVSLSLVTHHTTLRRCCLTPALPLPRCRLYSRGSLYPRWYIAVWNHIQPYGSQQLAGVANVQLTFK